MRRIKLQLQPVAAIESDRVCRGSERDCGGSGVSQDASDEALVSSSNNARMAMEAPTRQTFLTRIS